MNKEKIKLILIFLIGLLTAYLVMYFITQYTKTDGDTAGNHHIKVEEKAGASTNNYGEIASAIDELTEENVVIAFVKTNHQLPDFYVSKAEARRQGWVASEGNLCDVLPGKAIGGDRFSNREKKLPPAQQYFEADVNYHCGRRNADRIVFSSTGDVWLTKNHYRTFAKQ